MEWMSFWVMVAAISALTSWKKVQIAKAQSSAIQTIMTMNPALDSKQVQKLVESITGE